MYIYNVTVSLDDGIENEWVAWMKEIHIPDVLRTGLFLENRICKLLSDDLPVTYAVQYTFNAMSDLHKYKEKFAPGLQKKHAEKFKDKFTAFRTVLEIVE